MAIRRRCDVRYHASRSSRPPHGPLLPRGRGARVGPTLPPPCAPLCNLFRSVGRVGSLPLWSCRRCRSSIVAPSVFVCSDCRRFHISASVLSLPPSPCGVTPCALRPAMLLRPFGSPSPPAGASRLPFAPGRVPGLGVARSAPSGSWGACSGACPCRAPAGAPPPAPGGTPPPLWGRGSRFARHIGVPPGVFFGWRVVLRSGCQGVSPRCGGPRFAPLPPCPSARHLGPVFVRPGGPGSSRAVLAASGPCAPRGGRARRPPAPPAAPTRGAVFFIVFCSPRNCNFGALSALRRIKKHKLS